MLILCDILYVNTIVYHCEYENKYHIYILYSMILSRQAVFILMESGECTCTSNESPDDMTLGMCLMRLSIPVIHSELLHQVRESLYREGVVGIREGFSMHERSHIDMANI